MTGTPVNTVPVLIIAFLGWRVVSRIRRSIGRQVVTTWRVVVRVGIYAVLTLFLAGSMLLLGINMAALGALFGGLVLGALLGLFGLHLTRFETTPEGRFYTPNPYMGAGVSFLLVARLAYRYLAYSSAATAAQTNPQLAFSPLTMLFFGLLAGYYIAYFIGVFLKTRTGP
jgi:hypothetical protein